MRSLFVFASSMLALAAGCSGSSQATILDTVDLTLDFSLTPSDRLHTPYVTGAQLSLFLGRTSDELEQRAHFEVDDPSVFDCLTFHEPISGGQDRSHDGADCAAGAPGSTVVRVFDREGGPEIASAEVEVRAPTRVELMPAGFERLDLDLAVPARPKVVEGGLATFHVRYFDGDTELHGNEAFVPLGAEGGVDTSVARSYLFEDRDWLRVDASSVGLATIQARAGETALPALEVEVVPASSIERVELFADPEPDETSRLCVLAQPFDGVDDPVFGVELDWDVDGVVEPGEGDMYVYDFDPARPEKTLTARYGEHETAIEIRSGGGFVTSSNRVGCSLGQAYGARGEWLASALGVVGLALFAAGRRARKASPRVERPRA